MGYKFNPFTGTFDIDNDTIGGGGGTPLTSEEVEDYVGAMLVGTETLITVTYQDTTGDIDFVVTSDLSQFDNSTSLFYDSDSDVTLTGVTGYVANEHLDWTTDLGATNIEVNNITEAAVTQHEAALDHNALTNYAADAHVLHAGVTLTAGAGLTGGGTIEASRSFALDIPNQSAATVASGDLLVMADIDDSNNLKQITAQSIADLAAGGATLTQEQVEDFVGGMLGGTETLITVTYQDATGDIDFVVDNDLANYSNVTSAFLTAEADTLQTVTDRGAVTTNAVDIQYTATENDIHALEIDCITAGFSDVKAIDIFYDTDALATGEDNAVILLDVDQSTATGGDVFGVEIVATEGSASVYGLGVTAGVNPVCQLSGVFIDMDSALVNAADELTDLLNSGANTSIFVNDNDTITIGDAAKFEELEILFSTVASGSGISPLFEFSTGSGTWTAFSPIDGTNACRNNGVVVWLDADIPTWAVGVGSEYLIRITRQKNSMVTTPIASKIQIAAVVKYSWDKDGDILANTFVKSGGASTEFLKADGSVDTTTYYNADSDVTLTGVTGYVANEHIDHSGVTLTAGSGLSGGGTIEASRSFAVDVMSETLVTAAVGDHVMVADASDTDALKRVTVQTIVDLAAGGGGLTQEEVEDFAGAMFTGNTETLITATYQDADGTIDLVVDNDLANYSNTTSAFYDSDSDVTLSGVTGYVANEHLDWTADLGATNLHVNNITEAGVTQHEAALDHDALTNFVSDEHIAHAGVTLTAGSGLSGGGTIAASRSFNVDINSETSVGAATTDEVLISDVSDSNNIKKVTAQSIADLASLAAEFDSAESEGASTTTSVTPSTKVTLSASVISGNKYRVSWYCEGSDTSTAGTTFVEVYANGTLIAENGEESTDVSDIKPYTGFYHYTAGATATQDFKIDYSNIGSGTSTIQRARITIKRVA